MQPAERGRNSRAKVVLPAPLGPAMIQQVGAFEELLFKFASKIIMDRL
jgi:hypothetical protein